MMQQTGSEARTARALAGSAAAPLVAGLSFVAPEALGAVSRASERAEALRDACVRLSADFAFVQADEPDAGPLAEAVSEAGAAVMWVVSGPFGRVLAERGWTEGLAAAAADPAALAPALDEHLAAALEGIERGAAAGVATVVIAEELASTQGPLVPPDFAFDELFPRFAHIVAVANENGLPAVLHTDGDARVFLAAAVKTGFTAVHCGGGLAYEAFERFFWAARTAGLAVLGGLLTSDIAQGHLATVGAGTRTGVLAQAGGLLVCDDGGITTPSEMSLLVSGLQAARTAIGGD